MRTSHTASAANTFPGLLVALTSGILIAVCAVVTIGCAPSHTQTNQTPTATFAPTPSATSRDSGGLPFDCPNPSQPVFQHGATIEIQPDHGPVGTMVTVSISGLQPGCHLFLDMEVGPSLTETSGTPWPAPMQARSGVQWIEISTTGSVQTTLCVCHLIYMYALGYPPYPSVTPVFGPGVTNVGYYSPSPRDYFFLTVATPDLARPTVFTTFTVTQ